MEGLIQDLRYGLRMLRKSPGFTATAILALALGIASTTAIFSVVDTVLLHPLPYPESERILAVSTSSRSTGAGGGAVSPADYLDWAAQNHVFSYMAASRGWPINLSGGERPERLRATVTTGDFFALFGVRAVLGRPLLPQDSTPGNEHVVVLSHGLWKRSFGSDRAIVGKNIVLNGESYAVAGVMPASFNPDGYGDLWLPSRWGVPVNLLRPSEDPRPARDSHYLRAWARLKPGITLQRARSETDAIALHLEKQYPKSDNDVGIALARMQDDMVSDVRPVLLILLLAVVLVLLIGCANVANLLLARATARSREVSVRAALGASRMRLIRQSLTESVLLALLGGLAGVLLAKWAVPALLAASPPDMHNFTVGLNREVLMFSIAVSLLSGILFGLVPALHASRENLNEALREGERGSSGSHGRTRSTLVVAEVGLSLILLIGSGLLVRSFIRLMRVDPGFDPSHVLVFQLGLPPASLPAQQDQFYEQVVERLQSLPGVQSAGAVSRLPLAGGNSDRSFQLPGSDQSYQADIRVSSLNYFQTMRIPLWRGRLFTDQDAHSAALVAVINKTLAQTVFPGQDPIGKYILNFGPQMNRIQIVGVIGNVHHVGLDAEPRPEVYLCFGQGHWPSVFITVRTQTSDPLALAAAAQNAVAGVNKEIPLANLRSMEDVISESVIRQRFAMLLLSIFAGLAMLLAAIGLYGVMSYSVSQRTREIGVRMALGARNVDVLKLVVRQGMTLVAAGVAVGVIAALALTRLMSGLLFGVSAADPITFGMVTAFLTIVALGANCLPAWRAAKVDPMVALRYE